MQLPITIKYHQLKVLSSWFSNLSSGWLLAAFIANDILVLTASIIAAIFSLQISFKIEELLENL